MGLISTKFYSLVLVPLLFTGLISILVPAFAQEEGQYLNRRVEIWGLFYKLMVAAFIVGAAVQGAMLFIAIRFREGKVKTEEVKREEMVTREELAK
ncbi:MAG: heme transporter CcmC [Nitrososphaerales archaeon]